jgi:hypothetical protein
MKHTFTTSLRFGNILAAILLAGVPFHAFATVWLASIVGGYTALRLWSATVLAVCMGLLVYWAYRDNLLRHWLRHSLTVRLISLYALIHIVIGYVAFARGDVTGTALAYALLINGRFLAFFIFIGGLMHYSNWLRRTWPVLVLVPAMIVALLAILQYNALPYDFLRHFGYSAQTIEPFETINNNPAYLRVQSTLRGANPLGAYLVIIIGLLAAQWRNFTKRVQLGFYIASAGLALVFSFSRSAWIGALCTVVIVCFINLRTRPARLRLLAVIAGIIIFTGVIFISFGNNPALQNALFHTEDNSPVAVSSNDQRQTALRMALDDTVREPLGRGPGTAGPASLHNTGHAGRLAENYYLQLAQEVGWAGLALFGLICLSVAYQLWQRRSGQLALGLLAAFVGITIVNMLSHAWTDDTLAFTWWGLAAVALAPIHIKKVPNQAATHADSIVMAQTPKQKSQNNR